MIAIPENQQRKSGMENVIMSNSFSMCLNLCNKIHATFVLSKSHCESSLLYRIITCWFSKSQKEISFWLWLVVSIILTGFPHFYRSKWMLKFRKTITTATTSQARTIPKWCVCFYVMKKQKCIYIYKHRKLEGNF